MSEWERDDQPEEQLVERLGKGDGKVFLESIKQLKDIAEALDDRERDKIAQTLTTRLWRERHPLVLRGAISALGLLAAGVTARVSLEAIARSPERFPNWLWIPAVETLLHMGWGSNFTRHFLASMLNREIDVRKRVSIIESINALSTMGRQLVRDEHMVREAVSAAEPDVTNALTRLLAWAQR